MPVDNLELAQYAQQIRYIVSNGNALDAFMALPDTVRGQLYSAAFELFNIAHLRLAQVVDLAPDVLTEVCEHAQQICYIVSNGNALDEFMALSDTVRERLYSAAFELFNIAHLRLAQVVDLAPDVLTEVCEHAQQIRYIVSNGNALDAFMALPDTVRERLYPVARELFNIAHLRLAQVADLAPAVLAEVREHAQQIRYIVSNGNALDEFMALSDTVRERLYPAASELFDIAYLRLAQVVDLTPAVLAEVREHAQQIRYIVSNGNALDAFMALPDTVRGQLYSAAFDLFKIAHLRLAQVVDLAPAVLAEVCEHALQIYYIVCNGNALDEFMALPDTVRLRLYPSARELFDIAHLRIAQVAHLEPEVLTELRVYAIQIRYIVSNGNSLDEFMALPDTVRLRLYPVAREFFDEAKLRLGQLMSLESEALTEVLEHAHAIFYLIISDVSLEYFLTLEPSVRDEYYTFPPAYIDDVYRMFPDHTNPAKIAEIMRVATILSEGARQEPKPKENGKIPCSLYNLPIEAIAKIAAYCGSSDHVNGFAAQALADRCFNLKNTYSAG